MLHITVDRLLVHLILIHFLDLIDQLVLIPVKPPHLTLCDRECPVLILISLLQQTLDPFAKLEQFFSFFTCNPVNLLNVRQVFRHLPVFCTGNLCLPLTFPDRLETGLYEALLLRFPLWNHMLCRKLFLRKTFLFSIHLFCHFLRKVLLLCILLRPEAALLFLFPMPKCHL